MKNIKEKAIKREACHHRKHGDCERSARLSLLLPVIFLTPHRIPDMKEVSDFLLKMINRLRKAKNTTKSLLWSTLVRIKLVKLIKNELQKQREREREGVREMGREGDRETERNTYIYRERETAKERETESERG